MVSKGQKNWLRKNLGQFVRQYSRKAQRGVEPNDRKYDRKIENKIKRMNPEELSTLLYDADDAPIQDTPKSQNEDIGESLSSTSVTIQIVSWSEEKARSGWAGREKSALVQCLGGQLPNIRQTDIKRLARNIMHHECTKIILPISSNPEPIRLFLESIGAEILVEHN